MKFSRIAVVFGFLFGFLAAVRAGTEAVSPRLGGSSELVAPSWEIAAETAYLLGSFGNPNSYEIGAQFLTARLRWGTIEHDGWLRGYNQVYALVMGEPIFRGVENRYFGMSMGLRYNFVQPGSRWIPYVSGGVGLGWIDSNANVYGGQGQDFTFNILSAAGVSYKVNEKLKLSVGALYEHFSNGGQTDPNTSLNLFGPQIGATYSF